MAADVSGMNEGLKGFTNSFNQMIDTIQQIQFTLSHSMDGFFNGLSFFGKLFGAN